MPPRAGRTGCCPRRGPRAAAGHGVVPQTDTSAASSSPGSGDSPAAHHDQRTPLGCPTPAHAGLAQFIEGSVETLSALQESISTCFKHRVAIQHFIHQVCR